MACGGWRREQGSREQDREGDREEGRANERGASEREARDGGSEWESEAGAEAGAETGAETKGRRERKDLLLLHALRREREGGLGRRRHRKLLLVLLRAPATAESAMRWLRTEWCGRAMLGRRERCEDSQRTGTSTMNSVHS